MSPSVLIKCHAYSKLNVPKTTDNRDRQVWLGRLLARLILSVARFVAQLYQQVPCDFHEDALIFFGKDVRPVASHTFPVARRGVFLPSLSAGVPLEPGLFGASSRHLFASILRTEKRYKASGLLYRPLQEIFVPDFDVVAPE